MDGKLTKKEMDELLQTMQENEKTNTPVETNKLTSRKFIVWLVWSVIALAVVVMGFIKDSDNLIIKALEYYFFISSLYIGGNVATKAIKEKAAAQEEK